MTMRILLCDDTAELRWLLRSALEAQEGVTIVAEVGDGHAAIARAAETEPDVVVLDLEMPGPTPAALLSAMRCVAPRASIVTFSGHNPADVAGAAAREVALHVPKTTDLTVAAHAVCELGRSTDAA